MALGAARGRGLDGGGFVPSEDYRAAMRRLTLVGSATSLLAPVTIVIMVIKP